MPAHQSISIDNCESSALSFIFIDHVYKGVSELILLMDMPLGLLSLLGQGKRYLGRSGRFSKTVKDNAENS